MPQEWVDLSVEKVQWVDRSRENKPDGGAQTAAGGPSGGRAALQGWAKAAAAGGTGEAQVAAEGSGSAAGGLRGSRRLPGGQRDLQARFAALPCPALLSRPPLCRHSQGTVAQRCK